MTSLSMIQCIDMHMKTADDCHYTKIPKISVGFFRPAYSGYIYIENITKASQRKIRNLLFFVPQDSQLYCDSCPGTPDCPGLQLSHRGQKIFSLPRVVPCFPLLGLTPRGLFMGLRST